MGEGTLSGAPAALGPGATFQAPNPPLSDAEVIEIRRRLVEKYPKGEFHNMPADAIRAGAEERGANAVRAEHGLPIPGSPPPAPGS